MNVEALMSKAVNTCTEEQTLDFAARKMWDKDCGVVPVVDGANRVVGMITDRDICIAAYTQNRLLSQIPISSIGLKPVVTVRPRETVQAAEMLMQRHQVRRLAVVDDGGRLVGVLSINDLARGASRSPREIPVEEITKTLAAIGQPRTTSGPPVP